MKQRPAGTSVGGTSIVAVFVVLCLFVFAALSLISANSDLKLAEKTAKAVSEYYAADFMAEQAADTLAKANSLEEIKSAGFETKIEDGQVYAYQTFTVNEYQNLYIELTCGSEDALNCINAKRLCWQVTPSQEYETDDSLNLLGQEG